MKKGFLIECPKCKRRVEINLDKYKCPKCDATPKQIKKALMRTVVDGFRTVKRDNPKAIKPLKITAKLDALLEAISEERKFDERKKGRDSDMTAARAFKHLVLEEAMELWLEAHPEYRS